MVILPTALVGSTPPSAKQCTRPESAASCSTVAPTCMASRPSRSNMVTISTPPSFKIIKQASKLRALSGRDATAFAKDPTCVYGETSGLDCKDLVVGVLIDSTHACLNESSRHLPAKLVRNWSTKYKACHKFARPTFRTLNFHLHGNDNSHKGIKNSAQKFTIEFS